MNGNELLWLVMLIAALWHVATLLKADPARYKPF